MIKYVSNNVVNNEIFRDKEIQIIETTALFALYIHADHHYRLKRWMICANRNTDRYLPNVHLSFHLSYDVLQARFDATVNYFAQNSIQYKSAMSALEHGDSETFSSYNLDCTSEIVDNNIEKIVTDLEKCSEYEVISQILVPTDIWEKYKHINYKSFGKV